MVITKTYCYKLYRSKKTKHLDQSIDAAASVWNYCIAMHRRYYKMFGKYLPKNKLLKHITKIKRLHPSWKNLGSQAIQDVEERIDRSYAAFFEHVKKKSKGRKSPPHFRKRTKYNSFTLKQAGYRFYNGNHVSILGYDYKYSNSRDFEGTVKTVTVKRNQQGEFHLYVVCKQEVHDVIPRLGNATGYDFGLKHFLTASDGSTIDSPEWHKKALPELRIANRNLSHTKKGSKNRKRARRKLEAVNQKVANRRRDWFFKLANELVAQNAVICIEDLNLDAMKRLWGRKISDYAFAEFVGILEWKASLVGTTIV
ncbi:MAG: transposase, partial [Acidaminococcaceae bacterium]